MRIIALARNFEFTPSIERYIDQKINGLSKFIRVYERQGSAEARVEVSKTTQHHRKGDVFRAEVNLTLSGKIIRVSRTNFDIFSAARLDIGRIILSDLPEFPFPSILIP